MNVIFFGSDDFAAVHLESLIGSRHKVRACVTPPERAKGRGLKAGTLPVHECARKNEIPALQPENFKDQRIIGQLKKFNADLFVVIAYGKILPEKVLSVPEKFSINVHGSLLPKYRGAAPINWAIIKGEKESGLSIIKMNPKMDAGEVIAQEKMGIEDTDTSITLRSKMMRAGPALLLKTIDQIEQGKYSLKIQDSKSVTFAPKLSKELGRINWNNPAHEIHNLVRGLLPWPTAYTFWAGKMLKILSTGFDIPMVEKPISTPGVEMVGQVREVTKEGFTVKTGQGDLLIKEVHPESGRRMDAYSFAVGHKMCSGFRFE